MPWREIRAGSRSRTAVGCSCGRPFTTRNALGQALRSRTRSPAGTRSRRSSRAARRPSCSAPGTTALGGRWRSRPFATSSVTTPGRSATPATSSRPSVGCSSDSGTRDRNAVAAPHDYVYDLNPSVSTDLDPFLRATEPYLVLPFLSGESLEAVLARLPERDARGRRPPPRSCLRSGRSRNYIGPGVVKAVGPGIASTRTSSRRT